MMKMNIFLMLGIFSAYLHSAFCISEVLRFGSINAGKQGKLKYRGTMK
jgi:hypothetical protein